MNPHLKKEMLRRERWWLPFPGWFEDVGGSPGGGAQRIRVPRTRKNVFQLLESIESSFGIGSVASILPICAFPGIIVPIRLEIYFLIQ